MVFFHDWQSAHGGIHFRKRVKGYLYLECEALPRHRAAPGSNDPHAITSSSFFACGKSLRFFGVLARASVANRLLLRYHRGA
jgi:hypothetical protein